MIYVYVKSNVTGYQCVSVIGCNNNNNNNHDNFYGAVTWTHNRFKGAVCVMLCLLVCCCLFVSGGSVNDEYTLLE